MNILENGLKLSQCKKSVTPEEDETPAVENIGLGGWGGSCHKRRWAAIRALPYSGEVSNITGATPKPSVSFFPLGLQL